MQRDIYQIESFTRDRDITRWLQTLAIPCHHADMYSLNYICKLRVLLRTVMIVRKLSKDHGGSPRG